MTRRSLQTSAADDSEAATGWPSALIVRGSARRPCHLKAFTPDEVNGWAGKDLDLQIGPRRLSFTSETFILSFSLPHFHFHAVTAYDILRSRGVPLGKRDYEGRLRTRSS
jgi:hypothetical protein